MRRISIFPVVLAFVLGFLLSALCSPARAQAGGPPGEAVTKPVPAANLELTVDEQNALNAILEESKAVDLELENARLRQQAATNRADKVRAQYELVRLQLLTSRKQDPARFDVVYQPVERNGVKANEWIIQPRTTPAASPSPATVKQP